MSRIASVWLKAWPIARFLRAQATSAAPADAVDPRRPFTLVAPGAGGPRLVALNRAAVASGLVAGELLSNARSKVLDLQSRDVDPAADDAALHKLALWCLRYTPLVAPWNAANGADGLFLDITGCAHLFGGEAALLADLGQRLRRFGLRPRLAIADTAGAAWALARYGDAETTIVASGEAEKALQDLPFAALRLDEKTRILLRRLGFRRIGQLIHQPRAPLAARFGAAFLHRLDQALGRAPEPLSPLAPPPVYRVLARFMEAISTADHVVEAASRLLRDLAKHLAEDGVGVRRLRLLLFRLDGEVLSLELGLAAPSQDALHMARLIALRLERLPRGLEADFGFEAAAIHVLAAERMPERQVPLGLAGETSEPAELAQLVDRLAQRLGAGAVQRLVPRQSHIPERAVCLQPASLPSGTNASPSPTKWERVGVRAVPRDEQDQASPFPHPSLFPHPNPLPQAGEGNAPSAARPLLLLPQPEPAEVMAEVPEGPPRQFRWRGVLHPVVAAEGPERIAPEWWRQRENKQDGEAERDYYVVEDAEGRRFWLYRAGLYGRDGAPPCWFMQGLFA
jgi:protein ImuB